MLPIIDLTELHDAELSHLARIGFETHTQAGEIAVRRDMRYSAPPAEGLDMSFIEAMCAVLACVSPSRINPTQRREHADLWMAPT